MLPLIDLQVQQCHGAEHGFEAPETPQATQETAPAAFGEGNFNVVPVHF